MGVSVIRIVATVMLVGLPLLAAAQDDMQMLRGPGAEIRATVRDLRPSDRAPLSANGVVVQQVVRGGPAANAGLRQGDIITEFDALHVLDPKGFDRIVRDTPPGRKVIAIVWRNGVRREVAIAPRAAR